jgi:pyridoxamine 5'-phosphate oxidase
MEIMPGFDPFARLRVWRDEARAAGIVEPDAMSLASATRSGVPSVRIVLWRGEDPSALWFFTSYGGRKAVELDENPIASACFFFHATLKQVRIDGPVERLGGEQSDAYFRTRPRGSQIGAWISPQSQPIGHLDELRGAAEALEREYAGREVPRPPNWGGYRLIARSFEFWTAGLDRLHDRERYERRPEGWAMERLAP